VTADNPDLPSWSLRRARGDDAIAVATMHVRAWQEGYRGIVPDEFLDGLDATARAARYTFDVEGPDARESWIALAGATVLGMAALGPCRDEDAADLGEVEALYVLPGRWRSGVGSALLARAERRLVERGYREAVLWVLVDNERGRRFYEARGWRPDGSAKTLQIGGRALGEIRYRKRLAGGAGPPSPPAG
jgi:GNAT superfamily N-acetyltransferase